MAAGARVKRSFRALRGGSHARPFVLDLAARAEAGIDKPHFLQVSQGFIIRCATSGLAQRRPIPAQAQPLQILENPLIKWLAHAGGINVLEPQQKGAARGPAGKGVRHPRSQRVAEVQSPGRAGCEARADAHEPFLYRTWWK